MPDTIVQMGRPKKYATRSIRIRATLVSRLETIVNARNIVRRAKDEMAASLTLPDVIDELLAAPVAKEYPKAVDIIVSQRGY